MEHKPYVPPDQRGILPPLPPEDPRPSRRFTILDTDVPFFHLLAWMFKWCLVTIVVGFLPFAMFLAAVKLLGPDVKFPIFQPTKSSGPVSEPLGSLPPITLRERPSELPKAIEPTPFGPFYTPAEPPEVAKLAIYRVPADYHSERSTTRAANGILMEVMTFTRRQEAGQAQDEGPVFKTVPTSIKINYYEVPADFSREKNVWGVVGEPSYERLTFKRPAK